MEIYQLLYFKTLAQERSFSSAARKLFITQPALSQQIKLLEAELGTPLFLRNGAVVLTEAGKRLLTSVEVILSEIKSLKTSISQMSAEAHAFRLGTITSLGLHLVSHMDVMQQKHDIDIQIEPSSTKAVQKLMQGEYDLCIVSLEKKEKRRLTYVPLFSEPLYLVTSSSSFDKLSKPEELNDRTLILTQSPCDLRELILWFFKKNNISPKKVKEVNSIYDAIGLAAIGTGIAYVPKMIFDNAKGTLPIRRHTLMPPLNRELGIVHRQKDDRRLRCLVNHIIQDYRKLDISQG